ncbi:hypothetical protein IMZ48_49340 [Candidatus Bathyarchaeota archaeon]|nr:hypothetical protein [Candidatus Bathyarchaeota archaeon]
MERETKYLQYIKLQKDYLSFMLAVQRSIDPKIGLDPSENRSFGTLIRALKNHLGLNGSPAVAPSAKARDGWSVVIKQDLRAVSAEDWGETLVKAHRSARKRGIDGFEGWRPHVEFVEHVKRFYPHLDGALDVYLDRIQEDDGDSPRKKTLGRLVQFWVKMISRQGEVALANPPGGKGAPKFPNKMQKPRSVGDLQHGTNKEEPDTPNALERKRKEHHQDDEVSNPEGKKAKIATAKEKTVTAKEKTKETSAKEKAPKPVEKEVSFVAVPPRNPSLFVTGTTPNASSREDDRDKDGGDSTTSGMLQLRGEGYRSRSPPNPLHSASQTKSERRSTTPIIPQLRSP